MRLNPKLCGIADATPCAELQELEEGRKIEIFYMDQFEGVTEEFVNKKSQFAVYSSIDGFNYRLFVERGYYEYVKELYLPQVNQAWVNFWDEADKISKRFTRMFIYPIMGLAVLMCILSFVLERYVAGVGNIPTYVTIGAILIMFVAMIICNSQTKKSIVQANVRARDKIIEFLGGEKFDALVERQKTYMDTYYDKLYNRDDEESTDDSDEVLNTEETAEVVEAKEEATDEVAVPEVTEAPEVASAKEVKEDKEEKSE